MKAEYVCWTSISFFAIRVQTKLLLYCRLHREALKQSATDPLSGKIDVGILTTGLSSASRKRRIELAQTLKKLIQSKENVPTINYQKLFSEFKESSVLVNILRIFTLIL